MYPVYTLDNRRLEDFLDRHKAYFPYSGEIEIDRFLREILLKANEFVPSEAGSILLDDPSTKSIADRSDSELVFIAAFGTRARSILGQRMSARMGIVGHVYVSGVGYMTPDVVDDPYFYPSIDMTSQEKTRSVVCVPIKIESAVCGVLELINRIGPESFGEKDRRLLEIFADHASISIQNLLDARRAHEVAKRDGLTGLFNDRFLHLKLSQDLSRLARDGGDLSLIFLDLDNLKSVNDRHGHLAGSQVLREIGFVLTKTVSDERATLTRYGGDEFVLVLPGLTIEEGLRLSESIRAAIREGVYLSRPYGFNEPALSLRTVSASLGVASVRENTTPGSSIEQQKNELLRAADAAMYRAKESGKNQCQLASPGVPRIAASAV